MIDSKLLVELVDILSMRKLNTGNITADKWCAKRHTEPFWAILMATRLRALRPATCCWAWLNEPSKVWKSTADLPHTVISSSNQPGVGTTVGAKELNWLDEVGENVGKKDVGKDVGYGVAGVAGV